jgi:hypothetical protein
MCGLSIGRLAVEAPEVTLGDDVPAFTRIVGVDGEGFVGVKVHIALDGEAQGTAKVAQFVHAHVAQLRRSHAKVAEAEGEAVSIDFGEQPGALGVGREEFDDGFRLEAASTRKCWGFLRFACLSQAAFRWLKGYHDATE